MTSGKNMRNRAPVVILIAVFVFTGVASPISADGVWATEPTPPKWILDFEDSLANGNAGAGSPTAFMENGEAAYVAGAHGKAVSLDPDNFIRLDDEEDPIDYSGSFTVAYRMKLNAYSGVDPAIAGNKDWGDADSFGWNFHLKYGRLALNWKSAAG
ncbi:MAG: hypothetical protein LBO81_07445, partial [Clostridiales Family XIII bacterium]|nr:hypothetical protein [Clostridiales Family XIII bacterium]